jgi:hypothetical protein
MYTCTRVKGPNPPPKPVKFPLTQQTTQNILEECGNLVWKRAHGEGTASVSAKFPHSRPPLLPFIKPSLPTARDLSLSLYIPRLLLEHCEFRSRPVPATATTTSKSYSSSRIYSTCHRVCIYMCSLETAVAQEHMGGGLLAFCPRQPRASPSAGIVISIPWGTTISYRSPHLVIHLNCAPPGSLKQMTKSAHCALAVGWKMFALKYTPHDRNCILL